MFIRNDCYIAAWGSELGSEPASKPIGRKVLNEDIVLFRDQDGKVAALENRCAHRGVPLSCREIVAIRSYPLVEKDQFCWIWMGDPALAEESKILDYPYHNDSKNWPHKHDMYPIKCNCLLLIDNLMDLTHLGFVHKKTIGGNAKVHVDAKMETTRKDKVDRWQEFELFVPGAIMQWSGATDAGTGAYEGRRDGGFSLRLFHGITPETDKSCFYFWSAANGYRQDDPRRAAGLARPLPRPQLRRNRGRWRARACAQGDRPQAGGRSGRNEEGGRASAGLRLGNGLQLRSRRPRLHLALYFRSAFAHRDLQIVAGLEIEPELRGGPEVARQTQRRVRRNAAPLAHDIVHARCGHAQRLRDRMRSKPKRLEELFPQHFTGVDGTHLVHACLRLVVVDNLDPIRPGIGPDEADAPLVVDANAVLALAVAFQRLEAITRRRLQILQRICVVEHLKLASRDTLDIGEPGNALAAMKRFGIRRIEGADHPKLYNARR